MTTAQQTLEVRGTQVPYYRVGAGEPLLYLHGIFGDLFSVQGDLLPFHEKLAQKYEIIAPAHPGFAEAFASLEAVDSIDGVPFHGESAGADEGQRPQHVATPDRQLRGYPASKRVAHQVDLFKLQSFYQVHVVKRHVLVRPAGRTSGATRCLRVRRISRPVPDH